MKVLAGAVSLVAAVLPAQVSSSDSYAMPQHSSSPGAQCSSMRFELSANLAGLSTSASSSRFTLQGGFAPFLATSLSSFPLLAAAEPRFVEFSSTPQVLVRGSQLHLGLRSSLQIGGRSASVSNSNAGSLQCRVPAALRPGWQDLRYTDLSGTSVYADRAIGVLPLLDLAQPARPGIPFVLRMRAKAGDVGILLLSLRRGPEIPLPGYGHAFGLELATTQILTAALLGREGFVDLRGPAAQWANLELQALVLSPTSSYKPGAFSNVLSLAAR